MLLLCCLKSSDVGWHIRDKLRPIREHGSILLYVHGMGEGGMEVGGRERLYTYRYSVTTRTTPALRWAAMRAILMFHNWEGQSDKTGSTDHNFWRERRAEADSNRGPSAYQPNALPLGPNGLHDSHQPTGNIWSILRLANDAWIPVQAIFLHSFFFFFFFLEISSVDLTVWLVSGSVKTARQLRRLNIRFWRITYCLSFFFFFSRKVASILFVWHLNPSK